MRRGWAALDWREETGLPERFGEAEESPELASGRRRKRARGKQMDGNA